MSPLPKKLLFFIIAFSFAVISSFTLAQTAQAQSGQNPQDIFHPSVQQLDQEQIDIRKAADDDKKTRINDLEVGSRQQDVMIYGAINKIIPTCQGSDYCPNQATAMGTITQLMASMYANPPASGIAYTYDLLAGAGFLAPPAYAQGIGFSALSPFLPFWKVTRNISYMLLIVVMVAIGFMIIFRTKIDPKTVIGVQAALPKIVFTLILITFSYPIVGFMIDLMYLVMAIAISLMISGMGGNLAGADVANLQSTYMTAGLGDLFGAVFWPMGAVLVGLKSLLLPSTGFAAAIGIIVAITQGPLALLITGIPAALFTLIIALGLLFTFIRLLLLLANSYIQLLIGLILGPILLLGEAIPGKSAFSGWFLNIIANLVVFPATAVIIMFSVWLASQGQLNTTTWSPPFLGVANPGTGLFHAFLGLAVIFMAPTLVATIKKAFHPKPVVPAGVGTAFAPATGAIGTTMGGMSQFYYLQQMVGTDDHPGPLNKVFGGLLNRGGSKPSASRSK